MALLRDQSRSQIAFQVQGGTVDDFFVTRYRGSEGLSQLYRFDIELASTKNNWAFASIVGKSAAISINTADGQRYFHGIISRFEMTGETVDMTYYRAELVPALWLLTHRYSSRIFQNKTAKVIIEDVLTQGGIASDRFDLSKLARTYLEREYCVQYRETDFNFICRLMEEEGIWYYFEQTAEKHVLTLCEKENDYVPISGDQKILYRPPTGMNIEAEHIWRFRIGQTMRQGVVKLNDFDFKNPKLNLDANAEAARDAGLTFADYPGEYLTQSRGTEMAAMRMQEFEASRIIAHGMSNCRRLAPGKKFTLDEHPSTTFNQPYLVTSITHQGKQTVTRTSTGSGDRGGIISVRVHEALIAARTHDLPAVRELAEGLLQISGRLSAGDPTANRGMTHWLYHAGQVVHSVTTTAAVQGYNALEFLTPPNLLSDIAMNAVVDYAATTYQCRFECIPATVVYRPARVTPWPVMRGSQTARVVGPAGEEIHCDEYGRVRVQFNWDRQGFEGGSAKLFGSDSSCWIRVSQGMAGGQYGIMFIPRVGQEVVVDFLEGNPDKPLIVGRVYNKDHMPPYKLPDYKTRSVIKTHTTKGGGGNNEIRFEDLKDKEQLFIQAQRQMDTRAKASHFHTIGGSYHILVGGEKDGELSGELRELVHKAKHVHIKGELCTWVEKDESRAIGGRQSIEIGDIRSMTMKADAIELYEANHKKEVTGTDHLMADSIKIEATTGIELVCGGSSITLSSSAIHIQAGTVNINSGAGSPVSAVSVAGMSPAAAEDAAAADSSEPGKDTRYDGASIVPPTQPAIPETPGHDHVKPTVLEFQLLDADEKPVPGEDYKIEMPDGSIKTGQLDSQGVVKIENVADMGVAYITFPKREDPEWRFIRIEPLGGAPPPPSTTGGTGGTGATGGTTPPTGGTPPTTPPVTS